MSIEEYSNINILNNIEILLNDNDIYMSKNLFNNISFDLKNRILNNPKQHNHISFLICDKTKNILSYSLNVYFKTETFPFSLHCEINTINKYYKKYINNNKRKSLYIFQITRSGQIGMSKPCTMCANFIYNNYDNLNLSAVFYSINNTTLIKINKTDLNKDDFSLSSGAKKYKTNN